MTQLPKPVFRSSSIVPEEYDFLLKFCKEHGIKKVLEFGPGASTLAFMNAGCSVVSIEENSRWFQEMQRTLLLPGCLLLQGGPPGIMSHPAVAAASFDMAFVDGPAARGPLPRMNTLQAAMSKAPWVMLHDANRPGEMASIAQVMRSGEWKLEKITSKRGIAILQKKRKTLRIRFICNAHAIGGGEFSSSYLMTQLAQLGHEVFLSPCRGINPKYPKPEGVTVLPTYTEEASVDCDLLVFYANDHAYKLGENREAWTQAMGSARRTVAVLNFVAGNAGEEWFASRLAKVMFLNSTKEREFLEKAKGFTGQSVVLPPPVDLKPFLEIQPDYSRISFVRHSRIYGKYNREETIQLIDEFGKLFPNGEFWFMAGPEFLRPLAQGNPRIRLLRWSEEPVAKFLSHGSVFWYRLPAALRDQGPRVIVEAMAAGIPCMADNRDGAKDRITAETGWLCNTLEDYRTAVREIVAAPEILRRKGQAARQRAIKHFQPERWLETLLSAAQ